MASSTAELSQRAKFLRNSSPQEFDAFVNAFESYTGQAVLDVVKSSADSVLLAQGGARQLQKVLQTLKECDQKPTP